jgi:8-oxo-dGTP diphosphatase
VTRTAAPIRTDEFAHPYVTVDLVALTVRNERLRLLVIERAEAPVGWALPGAFVQWDEDIHATATRVGVEKLGLRATPELIALRPFGAVDRDPRRRTVTLPHLALMPQDHAPEASELEPHGAAWAEAHLAGSELRLSVDNSPTGLVFDHGAITAEALRELRRRVQLDDPEVFRRLLPESFTLRQLQAVHQALLGTEVNRDSFRRRVLMGGRLEKTNERESDVEHRPASLYRWRDPR